MSKTISRFMGPLAVGVMCAGLFALAPAAKADERDQRTVVTVDQPVEVPGTVLPVGTYVFKLLDSSSERKVVQVFNQDESHLITTFVGVPQYHQTPKGHTILTFAETAAHTPERLHEWFYPGENYGLEFNYPPSRTNSAD
jgi:hypothetical protein